MARVVNAGSMQNRQLAAVILRKDVSVVVESVEDLARNENLWGELRLETQEFVKGQVLESLGSSEGMGKATVHNICNLAIMIQASLSDEIWHDLHTHILSLVNDQKEAKIDTGLKLLAGIFSYLSDHLSEKIDQFGQIFEKTLNHPTLHIKMAALTATCSFL